MTVIGPDVRSIMIRWCQLHPDLVPLLGGRVFRRLPSVKSLPAMTVQRVGGGERSGTLQWIHDPLLQFDVFAEAADDVLCAEIAREVCAVLSAEFAGVVVTSVGSVVVSAVDLGGVNESWDETSGDARCRFDAALVVHPVDDALSSQ